MRLTISQVIVKGKGKPAEDKNKNIRLDSEGSPILKHTIVGYEVTDLDNEIQPKKLLKEDAGNYVFELINADLIKEIADKKANGEDIDTNYEDRYVFDIENATVNMRLNTKKDGSQQVTTYLKARAGVIRSLEIPELVVNFLDENGNTKPGYELFDNLKPKKSTPKSKIGNKKNGSSVVADTVVSKENMLRFAEAVKARGIDVSSPQEDK